MSNAEGDALYLDHIEERITRIEECAHEGREAFMQSHVLQDAVIRSFEVIGEAVKRLSPALLEQHPAVPWRCVAGFRDVLIHDYMGVDLVQVWNVVENELPRLKRAVADMQDDVSSRRE